MKIVTLEQIAHQAMLEKGFIPDFPEPIIKQLDHLNAPASAHKPIRAVACR